MENQVVRRRVNILACHLGAHEDISTTPTHLFPMSCSNSLNSMIRRGDSSMYFARQNSFAQACFMRQQGISAQSSIPGKKSTVLGADEDLHTFDSPMFSRPAVAREPYLDNVRKIQEFPRASNYHQPTPDFARPSKTEPHFHMLQRKQAAKPNGSDWLPKMDVTESQNNYIVALELPGVNIRDLRVEVNNQNLRVPGNRSVWRRKTGMCSINSISVYHKREIAEGPYEIVWQIPKNVNKERISAELVDGLLMITVPKLSEQAQM